ncbi:MAG: AAA domain-containing protein, partial [Thermoproteus sp.]
TLMREKLCQKYSKYIWDILQVASRYPLVHVELGEHFRIGEKFDEKRAELGWCLAYVLSGLVGNRQVSVVVPYTQMAFAIRILRPPQNVRVATIASYLGREDDIIISIFGKEQVSQCNTYYLKDPYTFNVQLSRQRNALFTIGSADILKMSTEYCIKISEKKPRKKMLLSGWEKLARTLDELQKIKSSDTINPA